MNSGVTITEAPADWKIIQRDNRGFGAFSVSGYWKTDESLFEVQVRLVNEADSAPVSRALDWQSASVDREHKTFRAELQEIPTGGLYRLETRITRPVATDCRPLRGDYRHHLGVGDVYVITGQSNASGTGQGTAMDPPRLGVHLFGNDECWKLATHPLEDATGTLHPITITSIFHGHSPWLAFSKKLQQHENLPIGLIPCALGGSAISRWVSDDGTPADLFKNMTNMVNKASNGAVAGILWYQGESDCTEAESLARYPERFKKLLSLFNQQFGSVNLFTGQLNRYTDPDPELGRRWSQMRELQRRFSEEFNNVHLVVCAGLPLSDEIHNSAASNIIIGERFADAALQYRYGHKLRAEFPMIESAEFLSEKCDRIKLTFTPLSGNWVATDSVEDFTIEDQDGFMKPISATLHPDNHIELLLPRAAQFPATLHSFYGNHTPLTLSDDGGRYLTPCSVNITPSTD